MTVGHRIRPLHALALFVLPLAIAGCDRGGESDEKAARAAPSKEQASEASKDPGGDAKPEQAGQGEDVVEVAADGTTFDPPVDVAKIPDGAWMCDMGSVHYASMEKGEGKCPTCGMDLVEKGSDHEGHAEH